MKKHYQFKINEYNVYFFVLLVVSVPVSSPPGNLSTLQGMSSSLQALRPQGPSITPSLANHYRDDLVNHVRGWPAEILEKQVSIYQFLLKKIWHFIHL